jgi:hypothetical protein
MFPNRITYFPAYEIVMDELRDYRWYTEDMLHITPQAVKHIRNQFDEAFFSEATKAKTKQVQRLVATARHRPLKPEAAAHKTLVAKTVAEMTKLESASSGIDFGAFKQQLELQLKQK